MKADKTVALGAVSVLAIIKDVISKEAASSKAKVGLSV
jgi:hypothetical protein